MCVCVWGGGGGALAPQRSIDKGRHCRSRSRSFLRLGKERGSRVILSSQTKRFLPFDDHSAQEFHFADPVVSLQKKIEYYASLSK